ncbi:hypothetical protein TNCV_3757491 [Trichonephila clavipes]|nr:hypothetical protein TNCV_3757491 [Trichonephila clavipes]
MNINRYTNAELADIHLIYHLDNGNGRVDVQLYGERGGNRIIMRSFGDEAHFWLNSYVNKQNGRIWSEANPQVYVETPLHPEKLTVWCALWAGGILQKR